MVWYRDKWLVIWLIDSIKWTKDVKWIWNECFVVLVLFSGEQWLWSQQTVRRFVKSFQTNCKTFSYLSFHYSGAYCGPYLLSWAYWSDGGQPGGDYATCANNKGCAQQAVQGYMNKWERDCNGDGLIDCTDFAAIHKLGLILHTSSIDF